MDSAADAPLIHHQKSDDDDDEVLLHEAHEEELDDDGLDEDEFRASSQDTRIGLFMWLLTFSAAISGLLFGFDTGVISATLVSIGTSLSDRELSSFDKSIITSCTALFALIASPISSVLADQFGRRRVVLLADILFIIGALVQAYSSTVSLMVVGRSLVGLAIGAASFVTPLYIAELAPAAHRGRLVTLNAVSITFGQVVAYVIGWAFAEHGDPQTGWRWMVGCGALPACLQCFLLIFMPETPRWLVKIGQSAEARNVIHRTMGPDAAALCTVDSILKDIQIEVREEEAGRPHRGEAGAHLWLDGWRELVVVPKNRRALTIACLLQGLQQLCGFNSLMYFSATIFTMLGFSTPTLTSLSVAITNFTFTVAALLIVDRIGRRHILLQSIPFMTIGLLLSGLGFTSIRLPSTTGNPESASTVEGASGFLSQDFAAVVILISMIIYVAAYALGLGNVPWMQSELFPLKVRSLGSGVATATNWAANFVIGLTFLPLMDAITPTWTFTLYGLVCALGWVAIWRIYPETTGLSLEEATGLLGNGWGVQP